MTNEQIKNIKCQFWSADSFETHHLRFEWNTNQNWYNKNLFKGDHRIQDWNGYSLQKATLAMSHTEAYWRNLAKVSEGTCL